MPALNFSPQFAAAVEAGQKTQSIRAPRKRPIRAGEWLALYTGQRRPECRKLGEAIVESVVGCTIYKSPGEFLRLAEFDPDLTLNEIARRDGFESPDAMQAWFAKTHGLPFSGHLIRWRLLPREEWRKT